MTQLFADGFEAGNFSAWSGTATAGTGSTITVETTAADTGTYGARAYNPNNSDNGYARCYQNQTFPASNTLYAKLRWKPVAANVGEGGTLIGPYLYQGNPTYAPVLGLRNASGTWQLIMRRKDGSNSTATVTGITLNTWYTVKLLWDKSGANPIGKIYLDGVEKASITDTTSGTDRTPSALYCDCREMDWNANGDFYYDGVELHDSDPDAGGGVTVSPTGARLALLGVGR